MESERIWKCLWPLQEERTSGKRFLHEWVHLREQILLPAKASEKTTRESVNSTLWICSYCFPSWTNITRECCLPGQPFSKGLSHLRRKMRLSSIPCWVAAKLRVLTSVTGWFILLVIFTITTTTIRKTWPNCCHTTGIKETPKNFISTSNVFNVFEIKSSKTAWIWIPIWASPNGYDGCPSKFAIFRSITVCSEFIISCRMWSLLRL